MSKIIKAILLIIIGFISIGLSIKCYSIKECKYTEESIYGGDAFTGIQNAAASTSKNVMELAEIEKFGFGSILLISGLTLLTIGITTPISRNSTEKSNPSDYNVAEAEKQTASSSENENKEE